jgi:Tetratricopeptide repeat
MGLHPYRMHSNGSPTDHDELVWLTSMNNLALVLSSQGKYEQAEEMHRQELNWFAYSYRMINTTSLPYFRS